MTATSGGTAIAVDLPDVRRPPAFARRSETAGDKTELCSDFSIATLIWVQSRVTWCPGEILIAAKGRQQVFDSIHQELMSA